MFSTMLISKPNEDEKFSDFTRKFLDYYFQSSPVSATWIGVHDYDSEIDDISIEAIERQTETLKSFRDELSQIDKTKLTSTNSIDARILEESITESIFYNEELREYEWNPMLYTGFIGNAMMTLITQEFAPLEERLKNVLERAKKISQFLESAKSNLKTCSKIHVETAIKQNDGNISIFEDEIPKVAKLVGGDLQNQIENECKTAIQSLNDFGKFLQENILPNATKDFRLGKELFEIKLMLNLKSNITPNEILLRAENEKKRVHKEMYEIAKGLYEKYYNEDASKVGDELKVIKMVLDKIVLDHCKKEEVMDKIKSIIPSIEKFVKEKNILTLDDSQPLVIRETPEYQRGVSVASLESPGPLEKNLKTFYNVTPIPDEWTDEQVESYLREYNNWSLEDLSIHEAIPGHYVQLYYSNRFPSIIRTIFGSGSMIEGWAVYAEKMMIESGYKDNDPRMKMINLKWYIRAVCNAIIDQKIHSGNMTENEAMELMMKEGFQEEREASGKWRRACLTSTQLSTYFVGYQEISDLRNDYKKQMGNKFSLKNFHETFLSFGSPNVKYIREIMLK